MYLQRKLKEKYEPRLSVVEAGPKELVYLSLVFVRESSLILQGSIKASADGSLFWYLQHCVVARATRYAFGVGVNLPYNDQNEEHVKRGRHRKPHGDVVYGGWSKIVPLVSVFFRPPASDYFTRSTRKGDVTPGWGRAFSSLFLQLLDT